MSIRMTDLKNFSETAQCKTMAEASRRLGITPPSLSESVKRLEQDLSCILFFRTRSGISLTPSGRTLLEKSRPILASIVDLQSVNISKAPYRGGGLVIGCHPLVASYSIPRALNQLDQVAQDFKIELRHDLSRHIQTDVQRGRIDLGIVVNPAPAPDLVIRKMALDEVCVWYNPSREMRPRVVCDPDLFQTQFILRKWKSAPTQMLTSQSLELIARMTEQGLGYGILPERVVELLKLPLIRLKNTPVHPDKICLVYRPEFGKTGFEKRCLEVFSQSLNR